MSLEREAKLAAGSSFSLPDLGEAVPGVVPSSERTERFVTSYYDTPDLRLTRWGSSLRYRTGEGWTVKLPQGSATEAITRQEVTFEGLPGRPPAAALDLVSSLVRMSPVGLATRLRTARRLVALSASGDGEVAEVADDDVAVLDGRRIVDRFREVEVELAGGTDDAVLEAVVSRLVRGGARRETAMSKAARALRPASLLPADVVVPRIDKDASLGEVVRAALASSAERLIRHDPLIRLGVDAEGVHQARVATRRLRSDLRTFREQLDAEPRDRLREELDWLGDELGRARDLDVLDDRLRMHASALPDDDARGWRRCSSASDPNGTRRERSCSRGCANRDIWHCSTSSSPSSDPRPFGTRGRGFVPLRRSRTSWNARGTRSSALASASTRHLPMWTCTRPGSA